MKRFQSLVARVLAFLRWAKGPAFVVVIVLGLLSLLTSTSLPWRLPFKPFLVISGSMRPTIPEGSVVFVNRQDREINVGNIVTFFRPDNPRENVTHRITDVEIKENFTYFKTKGDANGSIDAWTVRREAVWGTVVFHVPFLGYVISFTKTRPGVLLVVVLPLLIIAIDELRVILGEIRRMRGKKSKQKSSSAVTSVVLFLLVSYRFFVTSTGVTTSSFTDATSPEDNQVSTSCWIAPDAVSLVSPGNNAYVNTTDVSFSWSSTSSSCPIALIEYNVRLYTDVSLTTLYQESGYGSGLSGIFLSVPEGEYWWEVLAKDQYANISTSGSRHLVVDRTSPLASLSVSGSGYKAVEEKIENGDFESGSLSGWGASGSVSVINTDTILTPATVVLPYEGGSMVRVGDPIDSSAGNFVWENRLMQSIASGAKSLSLYYNFFTGDIAPFDDPGFFIRLNGQTIYSLGSSDISGTLGNARSTDWQQFTYSLSHVTDPTINLLFYAGNTGDKLNQSWVYLDKITTYYVTARGTADYSLTGSDTLSGVSYCEYKEGVGAWNVFTSAFQIPSSGNHDLSYRCIDNAGNIGAISLVTVITDTSAPETISDLDVISSTYNSATLQWTAPGNDGVGSMTKSASYDIRFSTTPITDDASFDAATAVEHVPAPKSAGETETLEISGLNPSTLYYFAVKSMDEAPNTSALSNVPSVTTALGSTINPGDLIINEMMWSGSSLSINDEWIELRNMTDRTLDLTGFSLTRLLSGTDVTMIPVASFAGKTVSPYGYFLISNFAASSSRIRDTIPINIVNTGVNLSNTLLQIKLFSGATLIDTAWNGTAVTEGMYNSTAGKYYSIERIGIPGDGENPLSWYTCVDSASSTDYFDGGTDERGTPGADNRSENEPLAHQYLLSRDSIQESTQSATLSAEKFILSSESMQFENMQSESTQSGSTSAVSVVAFPVISLLWSEDGKSISFAVAPVHSFTSLSYELTYDTDLGVQGAVGSVKLSSEEKFSKNAILLGTCSTLGACVYHTGVKNISLHITLIDADGEVIELERNELP